METFSKTWVIQIYLIHLLLAVSSDQNNKTKLSFHMASLHKWTAAKVLKGQLGPAVLCFVNDVGRATQPRTGLASLPSRHPRCVASPLMRKICWRSCVMYPCLEFILLSEEPGEKKCFGRAFTHSSPNLNPAPSHTGSKCIARDHCCCWQCFRYHSNIAVTSHCIAGCATPGLELVLQPLEHRRRGTKTTLGQ